MNIGKLGFTSVQEKFGICLGLYAPRGGTWIVARRLTIADVQSNFVLHWVCWGFIWTS